jgi:hypothetical protein
MFAYNPQTQDRSGEIIGAGQMQAANTNAQMMSQLGSDIGGALTTLAAAYGARKGTEAKGKNFKKFMGMAGDTFGMDGSMFADMEDYDAGMMLDSFGSWMPAMANAQLGKQRIGVQQNAPVFGAITKNTANIAGQGGPGIPRVNLPPASAIFGGGN